jgi:tetratricopeptide (TPR) repeat protein
MKIVRTAVVCLAALCSWPALAQNISAEPEQASDLAIKAESAARAGQPLKAAAAYEELAAQDASKLQVLAAMLVKLYAEGGEPDSALKWAGEASRVNPDPEAYMAGVYELLGRPAEARKILDAEIAKEKDPRRLLTLYWQLAGVYEKEGDIDRAGALLEAAEKAVAGRPEEGSARQRLESFRREKLNHGQSTQAEGRSAP